MLSSKTKQPDKPELNIKLDSDPLILILMQINFLYFKYYELLLFIGNTFISSARL